jgi:hypothetical protein
MERMEDEKDVMMNEKDALRMTLKMKRILRRQEIYYEE